MTILMYTIGVFVASLLTIFMVYKFMKRVNRAEFVFESRKELIDSL